MACARSVARTAATAHRAAAQQQQALLFLDFLAPRMQNAGGSGVAATTVATTMTRRSAIRPSTALMARQPFSQTRHAAYSSTAAPSSHGQQGGQQQQADDAKTTPQPPPPPPLAGRPTRPLSAAQRSYLDRALRVNQAGELAAVLIYAAQTPVVVRGAPHLRPLMAHMHAQEAGHLATFNELMARHRVRPTAMTPLWRVAATSLGWGTALISREAAMACTEAVETEIGEHYNGQVRELLAWAREAEAAGQDIGEEVRDLTQRIRVIRDEELEHLDEAVGEGARQAEAYPVLSAVIRGGCRAAIWISERV